MWTKRTIIVQDAFAPLARSLCSGIAEGSAGAQMFTTGLSPTGLGSPTHWVSSGLIYEELAALLESSEAIFEACQGQVSLETIQAMLATSVIRQDGDPHAVIAEAGLKLVSEEL
jgi:hypothetical protein